MSVVLCASTYFLFPQKESNKEKAQGIKDCLMPCCLSIKQRYYCAAKPLALMACVDIDKLNADVTTTAL
ncbi:MAG: hypothetical protein ACK4EY_15605 [Flavipsychrobacter sp.]